LDGKSALSKASTCTGEYYTEKRGHKSLPRAGVEPTIPVFERSKTVRALDRAVTGTGEKIISTWLRDERLYGQSSVTLSITKFKTVFVKIYHKIKNLFVGRGADREFDNTVEN